MIFIDRTCPRCMGRGWTAEGLCPECEGWGTVGDTLVEKSEVCRWKVRQTPFGRKLRLWREKRRLSFREVSKLLGPWCGESLKASRLSDIERGRVLVDKYLRKRLWALMRRMP